MRCRLPRPPHCATKRPPASSALATPSKTAWWSGIQCNVAALKTASNATRKGNASAVGVDQGDWRCFLGSPHGGPCHRKHRSRPVEPDDPRGPTARRALNLLGQSTGAAAEVEDPLAGHRLQTRDDSLTPVELRLRHAVITRGIPVTHVRGSAGPSSAGRKFDPQECQCTHCRGRVATSSRCARITQRGLRPMRPSP